MAQHDMNIANQGFPAFRSDLNDALAALVSNSSGATAPSTTFAHQMWVDTAADPSILKIRNADNDAWITIGSLNQTDDKFKLTPADGVSTDTISELTSAAGVTVDGVLLKDTTVTANTIKASGTSSTQGEVQLFEDTDNGTNYVAIKAPASIASDVTWTLPNADGSANQVLKTDGSGVLGWANAGAGKVLQVVSATTTGTVTTTSTSFVETGLEVSITPSSASSKILVMASYMLNYIGAGNWVYSTLYRGATNLGTTEGFNGIYSSINIDIHTPAGIVYLDSPSTTSSTLYEVYIKVSNASNTGKFNQPLMRASIVAMEIAA